MPAVYLQCITSCLGAFLVAGLAVGLGDALLVSGRSDAVPITAVAGVVLPLHLLLAIACGLGAGVVAAGWRSALGPRALGRAIERLGQDPALDRRLAAALLLASAGAALFAVAVAAAALVLVAGVERKQIGALLCGAAAVCAAPGVALLVLPAYVPVRGLVGLLPRSRRLPITISLAALLVAAALAAVAAVVVTGLDWRALAYEGPLALVLLLVTTLLLLGLWHGPLAGWRARIALRGPITWIAAGLCAGAAVFLLGQSPGPAPAQAILEHGSSGRLLVSSGRKLLDGDGDGYSAFLSGPDCDDRRAAVHPGAEEIPDNGIDDNCLGGDRRRGATAAAAPAAQKPRPAAPARARNLLLIAVDTLRADRLGVAGYRRDGKSLTPRIDQLAGKSAYFQRVYAQAPNTPRSFPSLLASRYPSQIAVDKSFKNYPTVTADNLLLFEVLAAQGIHTMGFSSHFYFSEERGIRQGFAEYDNEGALDIAGSNKDIAAPRIVPKVEAALARLAGKPQRFAMFVHLFEPHSTYLVHPEFPVTARGTEGLVVKYDYEIAFVDRWVGRLLDAVDKQGLADSTLVVLVSDHGEAFGVHHVGGKRMFFHGQTLYDELLRVPLLLRIPGVEARTSDQPVMLIDVAPTILDVLGIEIPPPFVGRSLLPAALGRELPPRPSYAELLPAPSWDQSAKAMVSADGVHKLIYNLSDSRFELYDLKRDPEERRDLQASQPGLARPLVEQLQRWIEAELPAQ